MTPMVTPAPQAAPVTQTIASVWALGRVRILVERGQSCGLDESLGKAFCFGEAITWLKRRPEKSEIDVIAMDNAYVPGSMVPYDSGRGWSVYRIARAGDGFKADRQRQFATKVRVPQGCMYRGVQQNAWYITAAGGRRVAVEASLYACEAWRGPSLYANNADYSAVDVASLDYTGTAQDYRAGRPQSSYNQNAQRVDFMGPRGPIILPGESTNIREPDLPKITSPRRRK